MTGAQGLWPAAAHALNVTPATGAPQDLLEEESEPLALGADVCDRCLFGSRHVAQPSPPTGGVVGRYVRFFEKSATERLDRRAGPACGCCTVLPALLLPVFVKYLLTSAVGLILRCAADGESRARAYSSN